MDERSNSIREMSAPARASLRGSLPPGMQMSVIPASPALWRRRGEANGYSKARGPDCDVSRRQGTVFKRQNGLPLHAWRRRRIHAVARLDFAAPSRLRQHS